MSVITTEQSEAYVNVGGMLCPICKSHSVITDGQVEVTESGAYQDCHCSACEAAWTDAYKLVAAESVED